jgi:hypothetical protein
MIFSPSTSAFREGLNSLNPKTRDFILGRGGREIALIVGSLSLRTSDKDIKIVKIGTCCDE